MKYLAVFLIVLCLLVTMVICNEPRKPVQAKVVDIESIYRQNLKDSVLATGWYFILENENGFKRQLEKTDEWYFIDPKPILVKEHFAKIEIRKTDLRGQYEDYEFLAMQVYDQFKGVWADATEKSVGNRLGLVINNKLVSNPKVNMRIEGGWSNLSNRNYNRIELEAFMKQLE